MTNKATDGYPRMAILEISPEILREVFQLPEGAEILDLRVPIDYRGMLEVKIIGAGWEIPRGAAIVRTRGTIIQEFDATGAETRKVIDWGMPCDQKPLI
jgi:hypothetical protein